MSHAGQEQTVRMMYLCNCTAVPPPLWFWFYSKNVVKQLLIPADIRSDCRFQLCFHIIH